MVSFRLALYRVILLYTFYQRFGHVEPSDIKLSFGAHTMGHGVTTSLDKHEVRLEVEEIISHPSFKE